MSTKARVTSTFVLARKDINRVVEPIIENGMRSVVVFVGGRRKGHMPTGKLKATRVGRSHGEIRLTIGGLNYAERQHAKKFVALNKIVPTIFHALKPITKRRKKR